MRIKKEEELEIKRKKEIRTKTKIERDATGLDETIQEKMKGSQVIKTRRGEREEMR